MPITLSCPKCKKPFRVRDESIGRKVRCPRCAAALQVPGSLVPVGAVSAEMDGLKFGPLSVAESEAPTVRTEAPPRPLEEPVTETGKPGSYADLGIGPEEENDVFVSAPRSGIPGTTGSTQPVDRAGPAVDEAPTAVTRPADQEPAGTAPLRPAPARAPKGRARTVVGLAAPGDVSQLSSGLRLVQFGMLLLLVPFFAYFGESVYFMLFPLTDKVVEDSFLLLPLVDRTPAGLLGVKNLSLWHEIRLLYVGLPLLLFFFLAIPGRIRCLRAPAVTQSRGLAIAAVAMTCLGFMAVALYLVCEVLAVQGTSYRELEWTAGMAALGTLVLAEVWFCMFVAQLGWPLGSPGLPREVAWFAGMVILVPLAILITHHYQKLFGMDDILALNQGMETGKLKIDIGEIQDKRSERLLLGASALLVAGVLVFFRYSGLVSTARKAVDRFKPEEA